MESDYMQFMLGDSTGSAGLGSSDHGLNKNMERSSSQTLRQRLICGLP